MAEQPKYQTQSQVKYSDKKYKTKNNTHISNRRSSSSSSSSINNINKNISSVGTEQQPHIHHQIKLH
jgi:hypothetical protein